MKNSYPVQTWRKQLMNINTITTVVILLSMSPYAMAQDISPQMGPTSNLHNEPIQPLTLPSGLDADKVSLGKQLFHEPRLSRDNDMACISCHDLNDNGANHRAHTIGRDGVELDVNTLTVFNSSHNHHQFWDGRARTLEQQIDFVVLSKKEFSTTWTAIIRKLKQDNNYVKTFARIYPDGINQASISDAIATFERSLITLNSRFDRYLLGDDSAISTDEKEGYRLFKNYGCIACHQGSNVGGNLFMKFGVFGDYLAKKDNITQADHGRFNVTGKQDDHYVFRVPSLRLVVLTAPYFHDGTAKTLEAAIKTMAEQQLGREIPDQDILYIKAFLETLVGEYMGRPLGGKHQTQKGSNNK